MGGFENCSLLCVFVLSAVCIQVNRFRRFPQSGQMKLLS